ncbi:hypothetical protein D8S78_02680 [Natrialba swarupiae]|nr:hypothetical protein [Natrialba swarupiae]
MIVRTPAATTTSTATADSPTPQTRYGISSPTSDSSRTPSVSPRRVADELDLDVDPVRDERFAHDRGNRVLQPKRVDEREDDSGDQERNDQPRIGPEYLESPREHTGRSSAPDPPATGGRAVTVGDGPDRGPSAFRRRRTGPHDRIGRRRTGRRDGWLVRHLTIPPSARTPSSVVT